MGNLFHRAARRLEASYAGSLNTYETILARLHEKCGNDEAALRALIMPVVESANSKFNVRHTLDEWLELPLEHAPFKRD